MDSTELAIRSQTLKEVRANLAAVRESGQKRLGFARAEQVVLDMQIDLLDQLDGSSRAVTRPKVEAAS